MTEPSLARWYRSVQIRDDCDECGERRQLAVISYRGYRARLCRSCYLDGWWRERRVLQRVLRVLP